MAKSRYLGFNMFTRPTLSWIWLIAKSINNELGGMLGPSALGLAGLLGSHYLIPLGMPRKDTHSNGRAKDWYTAKPNMPGAWHTIKLNSV
jgi:hypothetical protein